MWLFKIIFNFFLRLDFFFQYNSLLLKKNLETMMDFLLLSLPVPGLCPKLFSPLMLSHAASSCGLLDGTLVSEF